jgi:hypothetical protein
MPAGLWTTTDSVRQGCQMAGSDAPKIATTGRPKAAAIWAGPESLPRNSDAPLSNDLISPSGAPTPCGIRERRPDLRPAGDEYGIEIQRFAQEPRGGEEAGGGPGLIRLRCHGMDHRVSAGGWGVPAANSFARGISTRGTPR